MCSYVYLFYFTFIPEQTDAKLLKNFQKCKKVGHITIKKEQFQTFEIALQSRPKENRGIIQRFNL